MLALVGSTAARRVVSHMPTHVANVANMAMKAAMSAAPRQFAALDVNAPHIGVTERRRTGMDQWWTDAPL